jgi:hypothetical protein
MLLYLGHHQVYSGRFAEPVNLNEALSGGFY